MKSLGVCAIALSFIAFNTVASASVSGLGSPNGMPKYDRTTYRSSTSYSPQRVDTRDTYRPMQRIGEGGRVLIVDPRRLRWDAYAGGRHVNSGRVSAGKGYCADLGRSCRTPTGSFRVYRKGAANCVSSKFPLGKGGAPMPHCMFFKGGYAIHGSPNVPNFNASHGCVRVHPAAARWLHRNFVNVGTKVIVKSY